MMGNHLYIFLSIFLSSAAQLLIKWRMSHISFEKHTSFYDKFYTIFGMFLTPCILLSLMLTFIAGLSWMIAMTKFEISYAYPYTILAFVLILVFSVIIFHEPLTFHKIIGLIFISIGIYISSKSPLDALKRLG